MNKKCRKAVKPFGVRDGAKNWRTGTTESMKQHIAMKYKTLDNFGNISYALQSSGASECAAHDARRHRQRPAALCASCRQRVGDNPRTKQTYDPIF